MMKKDLKVACVQCSLFWNNPESNRSNISKVLSKLEKDVDIVVLPEMFTTGFSMDNKGAENSKTNKTREWLKEMASSHHLALTGSVKVEDDGKLYNRLYWVDEHQICEYDKRHLFTFAGEDKSFTAGENLLIVNYQGWRICPLICYDLRFPKWSRNLDQAGNSKYDLLIYVANWPAVRSAPWSILLRARAIENQAYLIGCNRVGSDNNGIQYSGGSCILDSKGEELATTSPGNSQVLVAQLSSSDLLDFRKKFPVLLDGDHLL